MLPRRRIHRVTFLAAGIYNAVWGLVTALHPTWFFRFAEMQAPIYPEIFACLGMVIGLYGILYFRVALDPESGFWPALVGLIGKILGPIGMALLLLEGRWPFRALVLVLTNDLVWWVPFGLYLHDVVQPNRTAGRGSPATG